MPNLQEIEQFKNILNQMGDEPEVLAERDEEIEDIAPPERGMPEGLDELLQTPEGTPAGAGMEAEVEQPPGEPAGDQPPPFAVAPPEQDVDLSDLLGDQDLAGIDSLEGIGPSAAPEASEGAEAPAEAAETPEPAFPETPEGAEEGVEELPLEDFDFELPEEGEPVPEEAQPVPQAPEPDAEGAEPTVEPSEPAPEAAGEDEFSVPSGLFETEAEAEFELPEEFAFPAGEEGEGAAAPAAAAPVPAETPEFELPAEAPEAAGEVFAETPEFELPTDIPEEGGEEAEISVEDLPDMPGFDIEGLDAEGFAEGPEAEAEAGGTEEIGGTEEAGEQAFGEEAFELPDEFQLPEEGLEQGPEAPTPEVELSAESGDEEAEFLKVLQEQLLPEEEAAPGPEPAPAERAPAEWAPAGEEAIAEFAEIPLEEQLPPVEAPPEEPGEELLLEQEPVVEAPPEEASLEAETAPEGEHIDLEAPAESFTGAEEFELDEFSLEGLGEPFGMEEEEQAPPAVEREISSEIPEVAEEFPEEIALPEAGELSFTDEQFGAIRRTLSLLPRNLKIAIEELIAEKQLAGEELRSLLALLIEGAAPAAIAEQVSSLTGERIVLPKVFERLSGLAFEERRRTFGYAFRENILPILRVVLLSLAFLGLLSFLGYRYAYKPLYANYLYRQGYSQIQKERYRMANDDFDKAASVWVFKNWFLRYADSFADKKQYQLAAEKYEQLLRLQPKDRKGKLSYASLLTFHLAGYEKADKLLKELLDEDMKDYDALLARGDNYLEWAQENESLYADARFAYASIIDYYGERPEVLLRMLRYFIRTDKFDETRSLKAFLDEQRNRDVDPELYASTYAELAGYWIDKGHYETIPKMLFAAMDRKMNEPAVHYQLARYYRYVQDSREEETALKAAIELLETTQPLDKRHLFMIIDSYNRRGETFWRKQEYLDAERYFQRAIERIEDAQARRIFGKREEFGLVYKNYGDIYYYISRDLEPALDLYLKAADNRYETPELNYKIGYIHYAADRYEDALLSFSKVVDQRPSNPNALYSLGNSLYQRGYYSSAQGYYLRLLNLLESREERIPYLQVYENPEHNALVEYIMKVYNNLGVTLKQLSDRSRDPEKESKALVNMTFSSERFDLLTRDPVTVERGLTKNLAYLNQGGILYPTSEFELQIYTRLPADLQVSRF